MKHEFPKWFFHKELSPEGKIIENEEQFAALGEGWKETPAQFDQEPNEENGEAQSDKVATQPDINEVDYLKMTVAELKAALVANGASEEDLKGLKKDQLIVKLGAM